jgi:hypothetical protein
MYIFIQPFWRRHKQVTQAAAVDVTVLGRRVRLPPSLHLF